MDLNLPLILFLATAFTGVVWLIDLAFFRADRLKAVSGVEQQFASVSAEEKKEHVAYQSAIEAAAKEPTLIEYSKSFFPVLALVFVVRSFLFEPFQIPSESMLPALEVGDFIVVNKYSYGIRLPIVRTKVIDITEPKRGDVMVFFPPGDKRYFIKRVIGLPGDKIRYSNNTLWLNGEPVPNELLREEYSKPGEWCFNVRGINQVYREQLGDKSFEARKCSVPGSLSREGSWVVPEGHYFMMGDNRDNSRDSREWLFVPEQNIVGKAVAKWMHWDSFFSVPSFSRAGSL
ncbi:signal peptidase I [Agaribacterium haliotis]|uniref:signal peptidase I n=1 Tax=Agaribacterium haliotis TaxID=2013869 RepID=UPI000BB5801E|nr:signal peptidase I [Agaribacterium haliotis]